MTMLLLIKKHGIQGLASHMLDAQGHTLCRTTIKLSHWEIRDVSPEGRHALLFSVILSAPQGFPSAVSAAHRRYGTLCAIVLYRGVSMAHPTVFVTNDDETYVALIKEALADAG